MRSSNLNTYIQLVEKLRCILSLPNLFPGLARRFPSHFAPFGLTALTALRRVLLKNRRLVKLILRYFFIPFIKRQKSLMHQCF